MTAFIGKQNDDGTVTFPDHEVKRMYAVIEQCRHALRLMLDDVDMLVLKHGFSAEERDSMLSVKTARGILNS